MGGDDGLDEGRSQADWVGDPIFSFRVQSLWGIKSGKTAEEQSTERPLMSLSCSTFNANLYTYNRINGVMTLLVQPGWATLECINKCTCQPEKGTEKMTITMYPCYLECCVGPTLRLWRMYCGYYYDCVYIYCLCASSPPSFPVK